MKNLLKIGQLKEHRPDAAEIQRLLGAAQRNLADARVTSISPETRFDIVIDRPERTAGWKGVDRTVILAFSRCIF